MGVLLKFHPQCTNTSSWVPTMCQAFHIYCQTPKLAQSRQWIKVASFLSHSDSVSFHVRNERGIQSLVCSDSKRSSYYFHFIDGNKEVLKDSNSGLLDVKPLSPFNTLKEKVDVPFCLQLSHPPYPCSLPLFPSHISFWNAVKATDSTALLAFIVVEHIWLVV